MKRTFLSLLCFALLLSACGGQEFEAAQIEASLLIPRALEDELGSIEIYLFETDIQNGPSAEDLESSANNYGNYKNYDWEKKATYPYPGTGQATMDGIPDRGNVWRFYARGLNDNGVLIGHGATAGLYDINPDSDTPLQVSITINAIQ